MPAIAEIYSLGLQVEIGKIDKELKKLWAESEGSMTRASLINLAVYSEAPGSLERNTQIIAKIAENHACLAIGTNDNRAASVILRDLRDNLRIPFERAGRFAVNGKINQRRAGHRAFALCPKLFQLLVDFADLDLEAERINFSDRRHTSQSPPGASIARE